IQISENPVQHDRTKHVEIDRHFIKEKIEAGIIELPFVRSEDQLADILTKAVRTGIMQDCSDPGTCGLWAHIGENKDFVASVLDNNNCSANAIIEVLVDKSLITLSASNMSLQMHELIQSMAREIVREKFDMPGNQSRFWISSEFYDSLIINKVTEEVEVLVHLLKNGQKISVDGKAFTRSLDLLSDELRLFYWHGFPFKYLP
nr:NB-ARC domains-containing protein [Tanacetum cinerariifolium]